jgi:hypothetical protein
MVYGLPSNAYGYSAGHENSRILNKPKVHYRAHKGYL